MNVRAVDVMCCKTDDNTTSMPIPKRQDTTRCFPPCCTQNQACSTLTTLLPELTVEVVNRGQMILVITNKGASIHSWIMFPVPKIMMSKTN